MTTISRAVLELNDTNIIQTNQGAGIVSVEVTRALVQITNYSVLGNCICTFGIVTNIINIIVFIELGFIDTVNISLLALAVSDLCSILPMEWISIGKTGLFRALDIPWHIDELQLITGGFPHSMFARITSCITAFITLERCLCVVAPLKVKRIITRQVTLMVMVTIYILTISMHIPYLNSCYLGWRFHQGSNKTLLRLFYKEGRNEARTISLSLAISFQFVSFLAVILFTIILVIQMKRNSKWRQEMASGNAEASKTRQKREHRAVKMVILIAVIFILCFLPSIISYIATLIEPQLTINGRYEYVSFIIWSYAFMLESVNSSVNIFVYYNMSTKYRNEFQGLFSCMKFNERGKASASSSC